MLLQIFIEHIHYLNNKANLPRQDAFASAVRPSNQLNPFVVSAYLHNSDRFQQPPVDCT